MSLSLNDFPTASMIAVGKTAKSTVPNASREKPPPLSRKGSKYHTSIAAAHHITKKDKNLPKEALIYFLCINRHMYDCVIMSTILSILPDLFILVLRTKYHPSFLF